MGTVNQGGDADTTGAICGMLAGAYYGMEGIPRRWQKKMDPKVISEIELLTDKLLEAVRCEGHFDEAEGALSASTQP